MSVSSENSAGAAFRGQLKQALQSKFFHDLRYLVGQHLLIKCFSLAAVSYAMRQLGPAGLGELGYAMAVVSVTLVLSNLGFDQLLPKIMAGKPTSQSRHEAALRAYSLRICLICCAAPIFLVGAIFESSSSVFPGMQQLGYSTLIWLAALLFLLGNALNPEAYQQGKDEIKKLGNFQLRAAIISSILFVLVFRFFPSPPAFLLIQAVAVLSVAWQAFAGNGSEHLLLPHWNTLKEVAAHVQKFWPTIANILVIYCVIGLDSFFLPLLSTGKEVGFYVAASTLCNGVNVFVALIPMALYPRILGWVQTSPAIAVAHTMKITRGVLLAAPLVYLVSRYACDLGVPLILGSSYRDASPVLAALICQFFVYVGYHAITFTFVAMERYRLALVVSVTGAALSMVGYPLAAKLGGAVYMAHAKLGICCVMVVAGLFLLVFTKRTRSSPE